MCFLTLTDSTAPLLVFCSIGLRSSTSLNKAVGPGFSTVLKGKNRSIDPPAPTQKPIVDIGITSQISLI
ncbi:MAG: hypothetical protein HC786_03970 [Richelia sp. CSU_2_1]|nr:hypothetical protein [Richelia sp. CSU_2_1]